jgi:hypothetical protein
MTGIVNSTGARSGVIGTTVGTPAGSVAGNGAFMARNSGSGWVSLSDGALVSFNNVSSGDSFDTDGNFDYAGDKKYEAPATGVYFFWYAIYSGDTDSSNGFGFSNQDGEIANSEGGYNYFTVLLQTSADNMQNGSIVIPLSSGNKIWVAARLASDFSEEHSSWGGVRLK